MFTPTCIYQYHQIIFLTIFTQVTLNNIHYSFFRVLFLSLRLALIISRNHPLVIFFQKILNLFCIHTNLFLIFSFTIQYDSNRQLDVFYSKELNQSIEILVCVVIRNMNKFKTFFIFFRQLFKPQTLAFSQFLFRID